MDTTTQQDTTTPATIYAVCRSCGHVEPRPAHAAEDWAGCETCGAHHSRVELEEDGDVAEDLSHELTACQGHPAEDCGPGHEHAGIGDVVYCDGKCRR